MCKGRVLVVCSDPSGRFGLTRLINSWGYSAREACSENAVRSLELSEHAVVINDLDQGFGRMNGNEIGKHVHGIGGNTKVILLHIPGDFSPDENHIDKVLATPLLSIADLKSALAY